MDKEQKSKAFGSLDREFENKCMRERTRTEPPSVTVVKQEKTMQALADQHKNNSEYFLEGAQNLLKSSTPLLAILVGFFAMEHKANQLLALRGYKVESHVCTQMALSRILEEKDLAKKLSSVFEARQSVGYRMFLEHGEEERKNTEKIITEKVIFFIEEVDKLIENM